MRRHAPQGEGTEEKVVERVTQHRAPLLLLVLGAYGQANSFSYRVSETLKYDFSRNVQVRISLLFV